MVTEIAGRQQRVRTRTAAEAHIYVRASPLNFLFAVPMMPCVVQTVQK
jgi:hypothetical protein